MTNYWAVLGFIDVDTTCVDYLAYLWGVLGVRGVRLEFGTSDIVSGKEEAISGLAWVMTILGILLDAETYDQAKWNHFSSLGALIITRGIKLQ